MTRQDYITLRSMGNFNIIYEYYKEHFDHSKHKPFLTINDLGKILPMVMGMHIDRLMDKCVEYYDRKFNIVTLLDKNGTLMNVL